MTDRHVFRRDYGDSAIRRRARRAVRKARRMGHARPTAAVVQEFDPASALFLACAPKVGHAAAAAIVRQTLLIILHTFYHAEEATR